MFERYNWGENPAWQLVKASFMKKPTDTFVGFFIKLSLVLGMEHIRFIKAHYINKNFVIYIDIVNCTKKLGTTLAEFLSPV
jgi:hypothetical protein